MHSFRRVFEIIEDNNCPLYALGERFELSDKEMALPSGRNVCLILVREATQILFDLLGDKEGRLVDKVYSCSGCTGLIKFQQISAEAELTLSREEQKARIRSLLFEKFEIEIDGEIFNVLPLGFLKKNINKFTKQFFRENQGIIYKGDVNNFVYVVVSGQVLVEDGPVEINRLGEGEVFGEMGILGETVATTSVRAIKDTEVLTISGKDFGKLLKKSSNLQMYMARLLAERLSEANVVRAKEFDACMTGQLIEMVPAELFQVFHMHSKTGVLSMNLSLGDASVSFREGCIINAKYGKLENQEAIFAMLAEREGVYSFSAGLTPKEMKAAEIGDFMGLLMEGVKRIDEETDI